MSTCSTSGQVFLIRLYLEELTCSPSIKGRRTPRCCCSRSLFDPCEELLFLENSLQGCTGTKFLLEVSGSSNKCAGGNAKRCRCAELCCCWRAVCLSCSFRFASPISMRHLRMEGSLGGLSRAAGPPAGQGNCWRELQSFYSIYLQ